MKEKLSAHQDTISILKQQKDAQIKLYKTQEDKEIEKVIDLENKVKILDNIVYKTGQSVQTMNMLNNKCRTSFAKPEFLKKAKQANPRLYDIEGRLETTTEGYVENYKNVSQDIRNQLDAEAKAIQIILTWIDNDIYSIVDACLNACEMWKAIKRLKQYESINVQDIKTNLYWEFRKFTSWDGESLESYYSRITKVCDATLVKQSQELKTVSYHKLYDILKQHQNEVIEIRAKRLARTANPLALVAQQRPVYHPQNHPNHYTQNFSTRSQEAPTRNKDNEISKEKKIDKIMALISLSFKKIYKPTNNNLRTSSNTSRANQDNSPRINRSIGYDNQRMVNLFGAKENVEQADWRDDTDDEPDDQILEAHYMYMAQIQEVTPDAAENSRLILLASLK
nr:hypothetical protein [Tanacetum cinerariifolium]